jgi:hypothetical protein
VISRLRRRMTYANVVSSLCLFFVLAGGSAFAASQITGAQIASNAITSAKVKNGSLLKVDFKSGQLPKGPRGPVGPAGPAGAPGANGANGVNGTARAYGTFDAQAGQTVPSRTKGLTITRVATTTGVYCVDVPGLSSQETSAVASPAFPSDTVIPVLLVQTRANTVCLGSQFEITTINGFNGLQDGLISFSVVVP